MSFSYFKYGSNVVVEHGSTEIPANAFRDAGITYVDIPDTVVRIGARAFFQNNLERVAIPDSVVDIGDEAFRYNSLSGLDIPKSIASLGSYVFADNNIKELVFAGDIPSISYGLFYQNEIERVDIPDGVEIIYGNSFANNRLIDVSIPPTVTSIGTYAFDGNQLTSVKIPDAVVSIDTRAFARNYLTSVDFGNGLASLGGYAFFANQLSNISIPKSVVEIGGRVFWENPLVSITIDASSSLDLSPYEQEGVAIFREKMNSVIYSQSGRARITGTDDSDVFSFSAFDVFNRNGLDVIVGFDATQGDKIGISAAAFPSLLNDDEVTFASANTKKELRSLARQDYDFVYLENRGRLFFNGNGEEKRWGHADQGGIFAILKGKPQLSVDDFTLLS